MATTHLDDINVIITENTTAPNTIAAHPDEDAANTIATADTVTPRARTRSITAAQRVVKKDLKFYMDKANLNSVESIINNMCNGGHNVDDSRQRVRIQVATSHIAHNSRCMYYREFGD